MTVHARKRFGGKIPEYEKNKRNQYQKLNLCVHQVTPPMDQGETVEKHLVWWNYPVGH